MYVHVVLYVQCVCILGACVYACACVMCVHARAHTCTLCIHACDCVCMSMCVHACACVRYVHVHVCAVCVPLLRQRNRSCEWGLQYFTLYACIVVDLYLY